MRTRVSGLHALMSSLTEAPGQSANGTGSVQVMARPADTPIIAQAAQVALPAQPSSSLQAAPRNGPVAASAMPPPPMVPRPTQSVVLANAMIPPQHMMRPPAGPQEMMMAMRSPPVVPRPMPPMCDGMAPNHMAQMAHAQQSMALAGQVQAQAAVQVGVRSATA